MSEVYFYFIFLRVFLERDPWDEDKLPSWGAGVIAVVSVLLVGAGRGGPLLSNGGKSNSVSAHTPPAAPNKLGALLNPRFLRKKRE